MAETIVSKVQREAKLESRGTKHPLAPPQIRLWLQCIQADQTITVLHLRVHMMGTLALCMDMYLETLSIC